jgi:hypothetical protein
MHRTVYKGSDVGLVECPNHLNQMLKSQDCMWTFKALTHKVNSLDHILESERPLKAEQRESITKS